jgi:hypothetical protein
MKKTSWQTSLTASSTAESSRTNAPEHKIESRMQTDLIFMEIVEEEWHYKKNKSDRVSKFKDSNCLT